MRIQYSKQWYDPFSFSLISLLLLKDLNLYFYFFLIHIYMPQLYISGKCMNRRIKHDFPFINICKVPREVLKTEGEAQGFQHFPRDLANVNE